MERRGGVGYYVQHSVWDATCNTVCGMLRATPCVGWAAQLSWSHAALPLALCFSSHLTSMLQLLPGVL
jgi:hypothetical protein